MAWWKVSTLDKKSCEEREIWSKDGKTITRINGFRWGTFTVETTDDNPPDGITEVNEDGIDMYNHVGDNIEQIELVSMDDGWNGDYEFEGFTDKEQEEILEAMEDDYYEYLETNDWYNDETQAWLYGPLEIVKDSNSEETPPTEEELIEELDNILAEYEAEKAKKVYLIKPLNKKSICWSIELFRDNADGSTSWVNIEDHYRWGQGFVEADMDCNLPYEGDTTAHAKTNCGWGAELDDGIACYFEYSDDFTDEQKEAFESAYHEGGAGWLFDGEHDWQVEDDYLVIDSPFQVSLCESDGTVIEENVKLKTRPKPSNSWPFATGETD